MMGGYKGRCECWGDRGGGEGSGLGGDFPWRPCVCWDAAMAANSPSPLGRVQFPLPRRGAG